MNRRILYFLSLSVLIATVLFGQQKASDQGATIGSIIPPGVVMPYAGAAAPAGWVFAYGQEVSQTSATYKKLYAAISTTYCTVDHGTANEAGAGSNLAICGGGFFRIPDMRGRDARGKDNMGGVAKGRVTAAKTIDGTVLGKANGFVQTDTPVGTNNLTISNHSAINLPAHYHGMGGGSTLSVSIDHDHGSTALSSGWADTQGSHSHGVNQNAAAITGPTLVLGAGTAHGVQLSSITILSDGSHNHNVSGSVDLPNFTGSKTPTGVIGLGSGSGGCDGNTAGGCTFTPSAHSISSNTFTGTEGNNLTPTTILNYIIKL